MHIRSVDPVSKGLSPPVRPPHEPWHTLPFAEVLERLGTPSEGLSEHEARERLAHYGPNRLTRARPRGWALRLLGQFNNVLLHVMTAAAAITAALGHWVDTGVLLGAVVLNAIIGFVQEGRAESALEAIRVLLSPRATVVRNGCAREIDSAELVPGDIVVVAPGDRVPADLRLIDVQDLRVEEAALTGESEPVAKATDAVEVDAPLGDRVGMAYSGTVALSGQARGVVVATGAATEIGGITTMLAGVRTVSTPLLRQIDRFGRVLAFVIVGAGVATFIFGTTVRGHPASEMFIMAVALTASAIPEGLPAIMTITLALGVQRMARRKAIVRRLPAVETLGSVTVICSDKTGTLTRNEMTVQRVVTAEGVFALGGVGYAPFGEFTYGDEAEPFDPGRSSTLQLALRAGLLCNEARLRDEDGLWRVEGDPTEGALLVAARKAGLVQDEANRLWPRLGTVPFEPERRFMATHHQAPGGDSWIFVKGAPETVLARCCGQVCTFGTAPLEREHWRRVASRLAAQGLRVLALARKAGGPEGESLAAEDVAGGCEFLGMVGIIDPPREEAVAAVAACHRAGIAVKMITGDHTETARAIGAQLAIGPGKEPVSGTDIAEMDDAELRRVVTETDVFARTSPEHKLRLVQALQRGGHVVAMTGDGVNDAPALKRADVGIAMGLKGTEAAKDAADIVLADDNFATIAAAVEEGRAVYDNIKKFILFMLPTNGGEALVVIAAILFELSLPLTPAQVLWINLVTSATLGVALAFEPAEPGIMSRLPRPPGQPLLGRFFVWRVLMVSVLMMAGALGLFLWEEANGAPIDRARTMAVNAVVVEEMFYLLNSRYIFRPVVNREGLTGNSYALLALGAAVLLQAAYTHTPVLQGVFGSTDLTVLEWMRVVGAGLLVFVFAELEKFVIQRTGLATRIAGA